MKLSLLKEQPKLAAPLDKKYTKNILVMATRFLVMKTRPEQTAFLVVCPRMYGIVVFDVADLAAESKVFLLTNYDSRGAGSFVILPT